MSSFRVGNDLNPYPGIIWSADPEIESDRSKNDFWSFYELMFVKNKLFSFVSAEKTRPKLFWIKLSRKSHFSTHPQWATYVSLSKLNKKNQYLLHISHTCVHSHTTLAPLVHHLGKWLCEPVLVLVIVHGSCDWHLAPETTTATRNSDVQPAA